MEFSESAIVPAVSRQRLGLGQSGKGVFQLGDQTVGSGASEQSPVPAGIVAGDRQSLEVSLARFSAAPRVALKIAHQHRKFQRIAFLGRERQPPCSKRNCLVLAE
jgi:hypothetical protein